MMNWLKARLNKDNFCNIMFWLGMSFGWAVSILFSDEYPIVSCILWWSTTIGMPLAIAKSCKITFTKEHGFCNSKGIALPIEGKLLYAPGIIFAFSPIMTALAGLAIDVHGKNLSNTISLTLMIAIFFFIPTLYFIIKNCPISLLFNKNAWSHGIFGAIKGQNAGKKTWSPPPSSRTISPAYQSPDYTHDPKYRGMSCNIYNSSHYRR